MNTLNSLATAIALLLFCVWFLKSTATGKKLVNVIRGGDKQLADSMEDVERDSELALKDFAAQIGQLKLSFATAKAQHASSQQESARWQAQVAKYENVAKMAGAAGNAEDVAQALTRKADAQAKYDAQAKITAQLDTVTARVRKQIAELEGKLNDQRGASAALVARGRAADIMEDMAEAAAGIEGNGPAQDLAGIENRIAQKEAKAAALLDIAGDSEDSLEARYSKPNVSEDDIAKYMGQKGAPVS